MISISACADPSAGRRLAAVQAIQLRCSCKQQPIGRSPGQRAGKRKSSNLCVLMRAIHGGAFPALLAQATEGTCLCHGGSIPCGGCNTPPLLCCRHNCWLLHRLRRRVTALTTSTSTWYPHQQGLHHPVPAWLLRQCRLGCARPSFRGPPAAIRQ